MNFNRLVAIMIAWSRYSFDFIFHHVSFFLLFFFSFLSHFFLFFVARTRLTHEDWAVLCLVSKCWNACSCDIVLRCVCTKGWVTTRCTFGPPTGCNENETRSLHMTRRPRLLRHKLLRKIFTTRELSILLYKKELYICVCNM